MADFIDGSGDILRADVEALVNPVNLVGVMGKGLALQFKKAYPDNFVIYKEACDIEFFQPGMVLVSSTGGLQYPRFIINFPTKRHWREQSRLDDIEASLQHLHRAVRDLKIKSIAIPALGCGLGGLDWDEVRPLIERALETLPVRVLLFSPTAYERAERRTG